MVSSFSSPLFPDSNGWGWRLTPALALPHVYVQRLVWWGWGHTVGDNGADTPLLHPWKHQSQKPPCWKKYLSGQSTCMSSYIFWYLTHGSKKMVTLVWMRKFMKVQMVKMYEVVSLQNITSTRLSSPVLVQPLIQVGVPIGRRTPVKGIDFPLASPRLPQDVPGNLFSRWLSTLLCLEGKPGCDRRTKFGTTPNIATAAFWLQVVARCIGCYCPEIPHR